MPPVHSNLPTTASQNQPPPILAWAVEYDNGRFPWIIASSGSCLPSQQLLHLPRQPHASMQPSHPQALMCRLLPSALDARCAAPLRQHTLQVMREGWKNMQQDWTTGCPTPKTD